MANDRDDRSADQIRREIEGTRAEMHETVDALERKLSPGQLLDEVWGRVRGSGSGDGAASAVGDVIRDHPLPLALMGLGMAWLAVEKATESEGDRLRSRHGHVGAGTYEPAEGRVGPYRGDAVSGDEGSGLERAKDRAGSAMDTVKSKASEVAGKVKSKASDAAESARSGTGEARSGIRDAMDEASHRASSYRDEAGDRLRSAKRQARNRTQQAKRGFWSAMDEQPLALGAVAFGVGLASGLAVPTTRKEDELMGRASESLKHEAKETARDTADSAKRVAKDTARAAKEEADRQDVVGDLKESVKRVATEAKETARERAKEEDLDADGMKDRAGDATERVKDRASG